MSFLKIVDGVPTKYLISAFRNEHKNVSFPKEIPEEILNSYDIYRYTELHEGHNELTQTTAQGEFEQIEGSWVLRFTAVDLPLEVAERNIRNERNKRLLDTDWMMLLDRIPTDKQIEYRQALRDITNQLGFPYNVEWPIYDRASDSMAQD